MLEYLGTGKVFKVPASVLVPGNNLIHCQTFFSIITIIVITIIIVINNTSYLQTGTYIPPFRFIPKPSPISRPQQLFSPPPHDYINSMICTQESRSHCHLIYQCLDLASAFGQQNKKRYLPDYMYPRSARYFITFFSTTCTYARYPEEKCVPPQPLGE